MSIDFYVNEWVRKKGKKPNARANGEYFVIKATIKQWKYSVNKGREIREKQQRERKERKPELPSSRPRICAVSSPSRGDKGKVQWDSDDYMKRWLGDCVRGMRL